MSQGLKFGSAQSTRLMLKIYLHIDLYVTARFDFHTFSIIISLEESAPCSVVTTNRVSGTNVIKIPKKHVQVTYILAKPFKVNKILFKSMRKKNGRSAKNVQDVAKQHEVLVNYEQNKIEVCKTKQNERTVFNSK